MCISDRVSDVPFGTFLSGGIDSSLVTALAQEAHNVPVKTFSIGFEERSHDESPYAKAVAEHLGTLHHEFRVTEKEALELIPQLAADMPEVSGDGLTYTIKIKKGVYFTDDKCFPDGKGRELKAADFVFAWKRIANIKYICRNWWIFDGKIVGETKPETTNDRELGMMMAGKGSGEE
jgi:ABC-type transport system substrate-binding protein